LGTTPVAIPQQQTCPPIFGYLIGYYSLNEADNELLFLEIY
jgi:hypothetical protein